MGRTHAATFLLSFTVTISMPLLVNTRSFAQDSRNSSPPQRSIQEIVGWIVKNGDVKVQNNEQTVDNRISNTGDSCSLQIEQNIERREGNLTSFRTIDSSVQLSVLNPEHITIDDMQPINNLHAYRLTFNTTNNLDKITKLKKQVFVSASGKRNKPDENYMDSGVMFFVSDEQMARRMATAFKDAISQCGGKADVKDIY
jgi:hypothetical protein